MIEPQRKIFCFFFLYSFSFGAIFPRIGDMQLQMGVGEATLGLSLVGLPLGVQTALIFADRILNILEFKLAICFGIPLLCFSLILASFSTAPILFFWALIFGGLAVGIVEVAVNLEADRIEYSIKKKICSFYLFLIKLSILIIVFKTNFQNLYPCMSRSN